MTIPISELKEISNLLRREYQAKRVIVYGSVARGEATEDSDIDLFVEAPTTEKFYDRMATVRGILPITAHGLAISPIVLTPEEVKARIERGDQFVQAILNTGVEI